MIPREPTADECSKHAHIEDGWYAIWYPQMGGYVGKAVVHASGGCFDSYVWHGGEFPFSDDRDGLSYEEAEHSRQSLPIRLHHCDPDQFIDFGETVKKLMEKA